MSDSIPQRFDCLYDGVWESCDKETCRREHQCARRTSGPAQSSTPDWRSSLNRAKDALEDMVDGGIECQGRDTQISGVIAWIDYAILQAESSEKREQLDLTDTRNIFEREAQAHDKRERYDVIERYRQLLGMDDDRIRDEIGTTMREVLPKLEAEIRADALSSSTVAPSRLTDPLGEIERVRQACYDACISCDAVMDLARAAVSSATLEKIDKLTWQVRDTCTRAERAEGALRLARSALRQWTEKYAHLQNDCGERVSRVLDYNLPPGDHLKALEAIEEHFKPSPYVEDRK